MVNEEFYAIFWDIIAGYFLFFVNNFLRILLEWIWIFPNNVVCVFFFRDKTEQSRLFSCAHNNNNNHKKNIRKDKAIYMRFNIKCINQ